MAGGAAQLYGGIGLSARRCAARGSADAKDASGWENAGRVALSTCGHGGRRGSDAGLGAAGIAEEASGAAMQWHSIAATEVKVEAAPSSGRDERLAGAADRRHGGRGSERGGGGGDRGGRRARRAGDDGDEIGDAVLRQPLHRERVGRALTVVRVLRLELREAALRRLEAAGVLRHRLVDAALRVRVRWLPRRLGQLATLEPRGQVLRRALLLARAALRLIARQRVDRRDERRDAGVDGRLGGGGVIDGEAVVRVLALELLEAALGGLEPAVELGLGLGDALVGVRIRWLAGRLGERLALEQPGSLLGHAGGLPRQALGLLGRRGGMGHQRQRYHQCGHDRASRHVPLRGAAIAGASGTTPCACCDLKRVPPASCRAARERPPEKQRALHRGPPGEASTFVMNASKSAAQVNRSDVPDTKCSARPTKRFAAGSGCSRSCTTKARSKRSGASVASATARPAPFRSMACWYRRGAPPS